MKTNHGLRATGLTMAVLAVVLTTSIGCSAWTKKQPRTPQYARPKYQSYNTQQEKPPSWYDKLMGVEEPKKPATVRQWMNESERIRF